MTKNTRINIPQKELSSHHPYFYLIIFILIFPAFIDIINGFIQLYLGKNFSIGIIYRSTLLLITIPFVFYLKERLYQLYILLLITLWSIFNIVWLGNSFYDTFYSLTLEVNKFAKLLLPFVLLSFFFYVIRNYKIDIQQLMKYIVFSTFIIALTLIFSYLTDIGISTYKYSGHHGSKSFFISTNALSLTLVLSFVMSVYLTLSAFSFKKMLVTISIFLAMILLGTRASIIGALGIFSIYLFLLPFYGKKDIHIKPIRKIFMFISMLCILSLSLYFFKHLLVTNPYLLKKFEVFLEGNIRIALVEAADKRINNRNFLLNIFGEGTLSFYKNVGYNLFGSFRIGEIGKATEEDIRDTIGVYGFILGSLILSFPLFIFGKMLYLFIKAKTLLNLTFLLLITLFIGHAFVVGHTIINPFIAPIIVTIYLYVLKYKSFQSQIYNP